MNKPHPRQPELRLVAHPDPVETRQERPLGECAPREIDWSILMARAQGGEQQAYRRLLDEIAPYVRSLAAASHRDPRDIEDAVQDVLLSVHTVRHTYDPARPFGPWLVAIAHRRIVDRLRRQGRSSQHETPLEPEHDMVAATDGNGGMAAADAAAVREAVESLPPAQREAIRLMKLQEMSLRQAAAASGMSIGALKVATHRGLKTLRKLLAGARNIP